MTDLLTYLVPREQAMLADLEAFVTRETPSTEKPLLDAFAAYLAEYAAAIGAPEVELVPVADHGDHLRIRWNGSSAEAPVLMLAHYDTVWPTGTLATMPFSIVDGVIRGPGVFDMKGGMLQGFWAVRALLEHGGLRRPVVYLCTSDEEIGSKTSRALIEREAHDAAAVLVLEPSSGAGGALVTARKGVGMFHVEVDGRAAHAGRDPFAGVSAIDEIARLTLDLHALTDAAAGTTVNVGVIQGGTRSNVIAAHAEARVDVRAADPASMEQVTRDILALRPHQPEARVRISGGANRPPMERAAGTALLYDTAARLGAAMGVNVEETSTGGGSDGNFCAALGRPVLDGMGAVGGGAHALTEHALASEMPRRAALLAALLASL
ncbi:MAG TPA: M20 family metallopeptidase [Candidatus Dormibacteraeota bacterium]|nr:M20 family metallopeptidase [Candidatus Dormibacteraeota bacterium]